jgi:hypothetical protein
MGQYLNFGPGPNMLPEPWQNLEPDHDIRKRLRFADESCTAVLAEHVVEHVSFLQGYAFFGEVLRVLERGGVLRLGFPDVSNFLNTFRNDGPGYNFTERALEYAQGLAKKPDGAWSAGLNGRDLVRHGARRMLTHWGHQMAWTHESAAGVLLAVGFSKVERFAYNYGEISGVDGHHREVGPELARLETTILEATK